MSADRERSLSELRIASENARAAFTGSANDVRSQISDTVTEIKNRISPANLKEEVQDHLRSSGTAFVSSLKRKASENPLQTFAIGAGLAYPLWNLFRNIPAPILMVGTGLVLAHQRWNGSVEENLTAGVGEYASNSVSEISDAAATGAETLSKTVADIKTAASAGAQSLVDKVTRVTQQVQGAASDIGQTVAEATTNSVQNVSEIKGRLVAQARKSGSSLLDFFLQKPLLVAGAGLAVGAFVAASVPVSESENRLFGQSRDELKKTMNKSVGAGVEQARNAAAEMLENVKTVAAEQGLSAENLTGATDNLAAGVRAVANKGMQALDRKNLSPSQQQQSNNGQSGGFHE